MYIYTHVYTMYLGKNTWKIYMNGELDPDCGMDNALLWKDASFPHIDL